MLKDKFTYKYTDKKNYEEELINIKENTNSCNSCKLFFQSEDFTVGLPGCKHIFHLNCIEGALKLWPNCPRCGCNVRYTLLRE